MQLHSSIPTPTSPLAVGALRIAATSGVAVLALGLVAAALDSAFLAPPLGVSVFNAVRAPRGPDSHPRTIVFGHAVGLAAGLISIALWLGSDAGSALRDAFLPAHAAAAGTAVAATSLGMAALRAVHPPALATTLVAALGLMSGLGAAVALLGGAIAIAAGVWLARTRRSADLEPHAVTHDERNGSR